MCRFWDPVSQTFKGEGCASLPGRLPFGHSVDYADLALKAEAAAAPPPPASPKPRLTPHQQQAQQQQAAQQLQRQRRAQQEYLRLSGLLAASSSCPAPEDLQSLSAAYRSASPAAIAAASAAILTGASAACAATVDAAGAAFFNASTLTPATAARRISVAFDLTGDLFCGCRLTVLDCAAENAKADAAARAARAAGKTEAEAAAAADAALRKVYPSPRDALLVPAVSCPKNSTTIMKVYYGESSLCLVP